MSIEIPLYHDPLPPRVTRKSIRLFQLAHRLLGSCCVVCSKPDKVSYSNTIE